MRGVGQTKNLIYTLPNERCMVVTHERKTGKYIENLLEELRGKEFAKKVKIVSVSSLDDLNKIIGYSYLIFFHYDFFNLVEEQIVSKTLEYAESASIVYHNHKGNFK